MSDDTLPSTIDELMAIDPLELSKRSEAAYEKYVQGVIAYHRNQRAAREAGVKPGRGAKGPANPALAALVKKLTPEKPKSPVGTGIRRI